MVAATVPDALAVAPRSKAVVRRSVADGGAEIVLAKSEAEAILRSGPSVLRSLGITLSVRGAVSAASSPYFVLRSGNIVGGARFDSDEGPFELTISPKVGTANVLQMMDVVGEYPLPHQDAITMATAEADPVAWLVEYVARELRKFVERHSFRDYQRVVDLNARRPRGRVDVRATLNSNWPRMQWQTMPCSYFDFTQDVPENQIVAAAVEAAARLAAILPSDAKGRVQDHVFHTRRKLAGVTVVRSPLHLLRSVSYNRHNGHFKSIHQLCRLLLSRTSLAFNGELNASACAFSVDMAALFEGYVRAVFRRAFGAGAVPRKEELFFPLGGTAHHIHLDGMHLSSIRRVIECKYRLVENSGALSFDEGEIPNAHLFQCVAYACHEDVLADEAVICYPSVGTGNAVEEPLSVSGFRSASGKPLVLRVLLVSLAHPVVDVVRDLRSRIISP